MPPKRRRPRRGRATCGFTRSRSRRRSPHDGSRSPPPPCHLRFRPLASGSGWPARARRWTTERRRGVRWGPRPPPAWWRLTPAARTASTIRDGEDEDENRQPAPFHRPCLLPDQQRARGVGHHHARIWVWEGWLDQLQRVRLHVGRHRPPRGHDACPVRAVDVWAPPDAEGVVLHVVGVFEATVGQGGSNPRIHHLTPDDVSCGVERAFERQVRVVAVRFRYLLGCQEDDLRLGLVGSRDFDPGRHGADQRQQNQQLSQHPVLTQGMQCPTHVH